MVKARKEELKAIKGKLVVLPTKADVDFEDVLDFLDEACYSKCGKSFHDLLCECLSDAKHNYIVKNCRFAIKVNVKNIDWV